MRRAGYTLVELMIVVAIIGVVLTMATPNFYRMRRSTRKTICMNNLRQIEAAVDRWVFENDITEGIIVPTGDEDEIYSYIRGGKPECPSAGIYTITPIGTYPQVICSIDEHTIVAESGYGRK